MDTRHASASLCQVNGQGPGPVQYGEATGALAVSSRRFHSSRAWSGHRTAGEGAILSMVRKHIDALEERVHGEIAGLREQQQSGRLRDMALARLEEKVAAAEGLQPKFDRRLAELTGNLKGLSDEMQASIRRADQLDERLGAWRRQFEEEVRQRLCELQQQVQRLTSGARIAETSAHEGQRHMCQRLARLEAEVQERAALQDDVHESLEGIWERLQALEGQPSESRGAIEKFNSGHGALTAVSPQAGTTDQAVAVLDQRLADVADRVDQAFQDAHEVHAKVAAQEQQQKALRTLFEMREEHLREWDRKLGSIRQAMQEEAGRRADHCEQLEMLAGRQALLERQLECMPEELPLACPQGSIDRADPQALRECRERSQQAEARLAVLEAELGALRADAGLAPRVAALVAQLRELVPQAAQRSQSAVEPRGGAGPQDRSLDISEQLNQHWALISEQREKSEKAIEDASVAKRDLERLATLSDSVKEMADGIMGEFEGLKLDVRSLAVSMPRREELLEVRGQVAQHATLISQQTAQSQKTAADASEAKQELARLMAFSSSIREAVDMITSNLAGLQREFQAGLECRGDMINQQEFRDVVEVLRQEIIAHKPAPATSVVLNRPYAQDLRQLMKDSATQLRGDPSARHDVATADASAEDAAVELQLACVGAEKVAKGEMDVTSFLSALDTRLDALGGRVSAHGGDDGQQQQQQQQQQQLFLDIARRVWEDQEGEAKAHQKLLTCIDELCAHLAALDSMVTAEGQCCRSLDLEHKFEELASRVAEMQTLERQLEAKVDGFALRARLAAGPAVPEDAAWHTEDAAWHTEAPPAAEGAPGDGAPESEGE